MPPINEYKRARLPNFYVIILHTPRRERKKERERSEGCSEVVVVINIHPPFPATITSTPELRLTHRLRLREALITLYVSILTLRYGSRNFPPISLLQFCENQDFKFSVQNPPKADSSSSESILRRYASRERFIKEYIIDDENLECVLSFGIRCKDGGYVPLASDARMVVMSCLLPKLMIYMSRSDKGACGSTTRLTAIADYRT
ncbi:hypothetical protein PIB30_087015 [Stylosanthes scabra]|uniref:Uncharacterized protein n=1 Tax=Stylosanthes scabra TaxID=79078 RepID=A0ABU6YQX4_9FABA|nr:hypothetical protein [Stylosanthes scabra]